MRKMTKKVCTQCSREFLIRVSDVNRGRGMFCGKSCASTGRNNSSYKHGNSTRDIGQSKEYRAWAGIKARTTLFTQDNYKYYSGRGIKMCDRWASSFENFLEDMGKSPSNKHSIDRIDNNGDYEPGNCRWATSVQQMNNTRYNKYISFNGLSLTQEEWGRKTGLGGLTILKRLKRGWSIDKALTEPKKR